MPRYFLHLRYRFADHEGDHLPDDDAAQVHAIAAARDLMANGRLTMIRNWLDCVFEITDARGRLVAEVPFDDAATGT